MSRRRDRPSGPRTLEHGHRCRRETLLMRGSASGRPRRRRAGRPPRRGGVVPDKHRRRRVVGDAAAGPPAPSSALSGVHRVVEATVRRHIAAAATSAVPGRPGSRTSRETNAVGHVALLARDSPRRARRRAPRGPSARRAWSLGAKGSALRVAHHHESGAAGPSLTQLSRPEGCAAGRHGAGLTRGAASESPAAPSGPRTLHRRSAARRTSSSGAPC